MGAPFAAGRSQSRAIHDAVTPVTWTLVGVPGRLVGSDGQMLGSSVGLPQPGMAAGMLLPAWAEGFQIVIMTAMTVRARAVAAIGPARARRPAARREANVLEGDMH